MLPCVPVRASSTTYWNMLRGVPSSKAECWRGEQGGAHAVERLLKPYRDALRLGIPEYAGERGAMRTESVAPA